MNICVVDEIHNVSEYVLEYVMDRLCCVLTNIIIISSLIKMEKH